MYNSYLRRKNGGDKISPAGEHDLDRSLTKEFLSSLSEANSFSYVLLK